jgi:hypothetical protein
MSGSDTTRSPGPGRRRGSWPVNALPAPGAGGGSRRYIDAGDRQR